jgi:hypothetical protein
MICFIFFPLFNFQFSPYNRKSIIIYLYVCFFFVIDWYFIINLIISFSMQCNNAHVYYKCKRILDARALCLTTRNARSLAHSTRLYYFVSIFILNVQRDGQATHRARTDPLLTTIFVRI